MEKRLLFSLFMLVTLVFHAKTSQESLQKTIIKSYPVQGRSQLIIDNKYGDIIVNTWEKNQVKIEVKVSVYGKNDELRQKTLKRLDINFLTNEHDIHVATVINSSRGFLRDLWDQYIKSEKLGLNKEILKIEYRVHTPDYFDLKITNKFGDVSLEDVTSQVDILLSNGNLIAKSVYGKNRSMLDLRFSNVAIEYIENADIQLKSSDLTIDSANFLLLNSSLSDVELGVIDQLELFSTTGTTFINTVHKFSGNISFNKTNIENIIKELNLLINYGKFEIQNIHKKATNFTIESKSASLELNTNPLNFYRLNAVTKSNNIKLPVKNNLKRVYVDKREIDVKTSGYLGQKSKYAVGLNINTKGGDLIITHKK